MAKKTKMTPEEQQKQFEVEFKAEMQKLTEKHDSLVKALQEEGFDKHGYSVDTKIEIDGTFLTSLSNYLEQSNNQVLQIKQASESFIQTVATVLDLKYASMIGLNNKLMEMHLENGKAGLTSSPEQLDEEDAKVRVKESKVITGPGIITE